ncbi:MAG TPA: peptidase [Candidatus Fraserbacteria bacterium]|nr:peptidase [Candidatus Fraserbacteria bacterium]
MDRLMGTESEYGLAIEQTEPGELPEKARRLIAAYPDTCSGNWDYGAESPLRDLRGFRAPPMSSDPRDARYDRPARRALSPAEEHQDRLLPNGARLYHDHGHPEYSTPECRSLWELIAQERAGERIVWHCAQAYARATGRTVVIYKNNTDFHGMSYGAHENYLLGRRLPFERLSAGLMPFLVTRMLYAGAGKVGLEEESGTTAQVDYQLSQRADFFSEPVGIGTLYHRPLINTRDEPHANARRYRRLHLIVGDANLSDYALALKLGSTALVLGVLEAGYAPPVVLQDPIASLQTLSRAKWDAPNRWLLTEESGEEISALTIQRAYRLAAWELYAGRDEESDWVLAEWARVLDLLEAGSFEQLAQRLDWAAKLRLLAEFVAAEGLDWQRDRELLQSLDLAYHELDPERGLARGLEQEGRLRRLADEAAIERAISQPPGDTRAALRGECVRRFADQIESLSWGQVSLRSDGKRVILDLNDLVGRVDGRLLAERQQLRPEELAQLIADTH